jgi:dTDP-4-dehydrorhamnose reductase
LARACDRRGLDYRLTGRGELSLDDEASIATVLDAARPWAVVNAAGWVRVDDAEADVAGCMAANADGAIRLARACHERDLPMAGFSSDLVFDGRLGRPYVESDLPEPLNVYGASKARGEQETLALDGRALMVRTAAFFSPYDRYNFAADVVRALAAGRRFAAAEDLVISPTYVPDLVNAVLDLLIDGETGLRHLANDEALSWAEFARRVAGSLDLDPGLVDGVAAAGFGWPATRPVYAALATERGRMMPSLQSAIDRFADVMREAEFAAEAEAPIDGAAPDQLTRRAARVS